MCRADPRLLTHIWTVKNWDSEESVGATDEIEELMDGSKWPETQAELARFYAPFAGSEGASSAGYSWQSVRLDDRNSFEQKTKMKLHQKHNEISDLTYGQMSLR